MAWFRVDDLFPQHPKVLAIPRRDRGGAVGLWTLAGTWCALNLTDGRLAAHMVAELASSQRYADHLVTVGLWEASDGGYQFHDWLNYNPSAEEVREEQAKKSEAKARAGRAGGIASGVSRRKHTRSTTEADIKQDGSETEAKRSPGPSRTSVLTSGGELTEVDARDPNTPPLCPRHHGMARDLVPDCPACGRLRQTWETTRTADDVFQRPPWCGHCDQFTRQREDDDRNPYRCPECHPLVAGATA